MFCAKVATHLTSDSVANFLGDRSFAEQFFQAIVCNKTASCEFPSKYQIFVATCGVFGDCEIMWIQA